MISTCPHCACRTFPVLLCGHCGTPTLVAEVKTVGESDLLVAWRGRLPRDQAKWLGGVVLIAPGVPPAGTDPPASWIDVASGELFATEAPGRASVLWQNGGDGCDGCAAARRIDNEEDEDDGPRPTLTALATRISPFTSVCAETALYAMPVHPSSLAPWLPARGRRILAFSDSRREAASLGPVLQELHERRMLRSLLDMFLGSHAPDLRRLEKKILAFEGDKDFVRELAAAQRELAIAKEGYTFEALAMAMADDGDAQRWLLEFCEANPTIVERDEWTKEAWKQRLSVIAGGLEERPPGEIVYRLATELALRPGRGTTLETLGLVEIVYPQLRAIAPPDAWLGGLPTDDARRRAREQWATLLALLCDTLRMEGVVALREPLGGEDATIDYTGRFVTRERKGYGALAFTSASLEGRRARLVSRWLQSLSGTDQTPTRMPCEAYRRMRSTRYFSQGFPGSRQSPSISMN